MLNFARFLVLMVVFAALGLLSLCVPAPPTRVAEKSAAKNLRAHVEHLAQMDPPRTGPVGLKIAADYIAAAFQPHSPKVSRQVFTVDGQDYQNIIAHFGPETAEKIVVGAHYDAALNLPGADDNASGVAGILELARILKGVDLDQRVELVAYALEEPPYFRTPDMGSAHHAQSAGNVTVMISVEMIGYFSDAAGSQSYPVDALSYFYPDRGDFVAVVGRFSDLRWIRRIKGLMEAGSHMPVESLSAPAALEGIDYSDHLNYWQAGYPAVMITDTSFFRNAHYHTAGDRPETLDYQRMAQVVNGLARTVVNLAQDE